MSRDPMATVIGEQMKDVLVQVLVNDGFSESKATDQAEVILAALDADGYRIVDGALLDELVAVADQLRKV